MVEITFEQLPQAVKQLFNKLENIERLLAEKDSQPLTIKDAWLSLAELCEYLPDKPAKPTVYGWIHHNIVPCHKKGKKLYFLKSEIDEWLKQGRKKTVAETACEVEQYLSTKKGLNNGK